MSLICQLVRVGSFATAEIRRYEEVLLSTGRGKQDLTAVIVEEVLLVAV